LFEIKGDRGRTNLVIMIIALSRFLMGGNMVIINANLAMVFSELSG
jgi:hypothetical protein